VELEEMEMSPRYRPGSINYLCQKTKFSENEIKILYRGFKAECPSGIAKEETFKQIYSQFFPPEGT
jgi:Ca2+-binding EF-hand superfamily protein